MNATHISQLQTNPSASLSQQDMVLANHLFGSADNQVNRNVIASHFKGPLLVACIVGIFLLPVSDELVAKIYAKSDDNKYTGIMIKMVLAAVLYYVLSNWTFARV